MRSILKMLCNLLKDTCINPEFVRHKTPKEFCIQKIQKPRFCIKKELLIFGILIFVLNLNLVFAELNYTTGNIVYGVLADTGNTNVTGALNLTLQMGTCFLANCSDVNWSAVYTNSSYTSLASLTNTTYFQYKATFFTENSNYTSYFFNATIDYTYIDTVYPLLNFASPTPLNNSVASGSFVINVSIVEANLKNLTLNWNGALTAFNSSNESLTNLGSGNWVFTYTQSGLVIGQNYTYNISVSDYAGNLNNTETRTIKGNTAPGVVSVLYAPNSTDELDPGMNIVVTVNISDTDNNFDSALLQWKNSTSSIWNNISMQNQTVKSFYTILNASLTLPSYEDNMTFRITANDTTGDSNFSDNYTLQSFWDCTWSVSPSSLEEVIGFYEDTSIGNITLINTGDVQYANNNCSISFAISYTGFSSTYTDLLAGSINWATGNRVFQYTSPVIVNASSNQTFIVNASFPSTTSPFTETPTITITSSINDSITRNRTASVSSTLIISPPNPLLYQSIETYPSTYISLTPGNFSLKSYLRNLGYDTSNIVNTTAHNVSFNWTLPSAISSRILEGNENSFYELLDNSSRQYNNLTIALTSANLASMSKGALNITIYSYGYQNESGNFSLIENSGGSTLLNETVTIQFLCYDVSDSVCVSACGIGVDPDCVAATTSTASSSGGGGGGGVPLAEKVVTSAEFQLVRGEQNEIKIIFKNEDNNNSLKNLTFSVSGKISKYIEINPKQISYLGPKEQIAITLSITSPTYVELGKQELIVTMGGRKGSASYTDSKKITIEIHELSLKKANELLNESRELIRQLNEANLSSDYLNDLLNKSEIEINAFNLEVVKNNYNLIQEEAKYALDSVEIINELESLIKSAEKKGIEVKDSTRLLKLAKLSIERREFEQAYKRVKESQLVYALEVKGELGKLSYYLQEYPKEISLGAFFLVLFSFGSYNLNKLRVIKKKIKQLKEEEKILDELIRVVQNECFKKKKMSMNEYQTAMEEYNGKLSKVIEGLIELETKRVHMLRFTSKTKRLKLEKEKIIGLIKELQEDYMKKKKFETRTFELKMVSFNKRISEIEEKLATLEAKKAVKGFGISLKIPKGK
jgi:hypothetical protein